MKPALVFLAIVLSIPWLLLLVMRPTAAAGEQWTVLAWLLPTVWSPTLIALLVTRFTEGAGSVTREIRARFKYRRGAWRWLLVAALVPPLAMAVAVATARAAGDMASFIPTGAIPVMIVLQLLTGATGEELGWRGFLLPRLGERFGDIRAAWLMAFFWSVWHLPAFFFPGMPHQMMPAAANLLFTMFFGVFLAWVFRRTAGFVLAPMLAHLALNVSSGIGGAQFTSGVLWWMLVAIFGAIAILGSIASRQSATKPEVDYA
jgi:membrane protease YdiL (CAAX protease family)